MPAGRLRVARPSVVYNNIYTISLAPSAFLGIKSLMVVRPPGSRPIHRPRRWGPPRAQPPALAGLTRTPPGPTQHLNSGQPESAWVPFGQLPGGPPLRQKWSAEKMARHGQETVKFCDAGQSLTQVGPKDGPADGQVFPPRRRRDDAAQNFNFGGRRGSEGAAVKPRSNFGWWPPPAAPTDL